MRGGRILESGPVEQILSAPTHDYTKSILASHLTVEKAMRQRREKMRALTP